MMKLCSFCHFLSMNKFNLISSFIINYIQIFFPKKNTAYWISVENNIEPIFPDGQMHYMENRYYLESKWGPSVGMILSQIAERTSSMSETIICAWNSMPVWGWNYEILTQILITGHNFENPITLKRVRKETDFLLYSKSRGCFRYKNDILPLITLLFTKSLLWNEKLLKMKISQTIWLVTFQMTLETLILTE